MAPTVLASYASTTDAATHVVPLSANPSMNTLWVAVFSSGVVTPSGTWSTEYSNIDDAHIAVFRMDNPSTSMTSVTLGVSAAANLAAVIFEAQRDTADTPYVNFAEFFPGSGTWPTPSLSWTGKDDAVVINLADNPSPTTGDITSWNNTFTQIADTGLAASSGSLQPGRVWAAHRAVASFTGTVTATCSPSFSTSGGTNVTTSGVIAYKAAAASPTANAGPDQGVASGAAVTLDGTGSTPGSGTISSYAWTQISGAAVTLSSSSVAQPTFTAPVGPATLVFGLTVTNSGAVTSAQDTVTITVGAPAAGPTPSVKDENANSTGVADRSAWFNLVGQAAMPGFVRKSYYEPGQTAQFSIDYNSAYTCNVYRLGWYGSESTGARLVDTFAGTATNQPAAVPIANSNGAIECSNWSVNVSWAIPADATPGWYNLVLKGSNGVDDGQILFCVADTALPTKRRVVVLSAEATWMGAYSYYGGKTNVLGGASLYGSNGPMSGGLANRAYCVSYDRPVVTAEGVEQTYFFSAEYPLLRTLERFGFDVGYVTCEQVDADPTVLDGRDLIIVSGHNEYISPAIKDKFDALAAAGQNMMNLSGNDFFWRTRYGTTNYAATTTKGRVMWCRKDTMSGPGGHVAGTEIVSGDWGGTWQDTRWAGREPTMDLWGDRFIANGVRSDNLKVPFEYKGLPLYRNCTGIQALTSGQTFDFGAGTLGMEWDKPETSHAFAPLSASTVDLTNNTSDVNGQNYNLSSTQTHQMIMLTHGTGGYIFNASDVWFSWILDDFHVMGGAVSSNEGRQMLLNLMADLGVLGDSSLVTGAGLTQPTPVSDVGTSYGLAAITTTPVTIFPPAATATASAVPATVTAITPFVIIVADTGTATANSTTATVTAIDPAAIPAAIWDASGMVLEDLIEETLLQLQGYTTKGDKVTSLAEPIEAGTMTFRLDDVSDFSRGVIEIDGELMRLASVNRQGGTVTVLPRGRGWRGTVATIHNEGALVTMAPLVPRVSVAWAINDTIVGLYPSLFGVATTEFTFNSVNTVSWLVPADAEAILSVRYRDYFGNWQRIRRWELENAMRVSDFASGKALRIVDVPVGRTVQVVYAKKPTALPSLLTPFSSSGLDPAWRDIVILGAQAKILPSLDTARLSLRSASADEMDQPVQLGSAVSLAKDLRARYQERVQQEQQVLQNRYPTTIHFTR